MTVSDAAQDHSVGPMCVDTEHKLASPVHGAGTDVRPGGASPTNDGVSRCVKAEVAAAGAECSYGKAAGAGGVADGGSTAAGMSALTDLPYMSISLSVGGMRRCIVAAEVFSSLAMCRRVWAQCALPQRLMQPHLSHAVGWRVRR